MKCECGFEFSPDMEFRENEAPKNKDNETIITCPECG